MALQGFDKEYYLAAKLAALQADPAYATDWATKTTTDLEAFLKIEGFTPESHYQAYGWAEGLAPNALFNAAEYKQAKFEALVADGEYDTVAEAEAAFDEAWPFNPYLHYVQYGSAEGINPSNAFDESEYLASKLADLKADPDTATEWADKTVADVRAAFTAAGLSALGHYQAWGEDEGIAVTEVPADEKVADDGGEEVPGETFTLTASADSVDEGGSVDFTLANGEANTEYAYKVTGDGAAAQIAAVTTDADGNATISVDASDVLSTDQAITVSIIGEDLTSTVTAVAVNDAPALTDAAATLADGVEDAAYTVDAADLLAGYTDEEGDAISVTNLTADNDATVVDNGDGSFTITPVADFNGTVTLSYDVTDGTDATAATQAVVFAAVNDAPTTTAATAAATEAGAAVEGQLVAEDVDGDELTFSLDAAVEGLTLNDDGSYSFDPSANTAVQALTYTDSALDVVANYTVDDGNGGTAQNTLTITVDPTPLTFSIVETESFVVEGSTVTYTLEASEAVQSDFTGEIQLVPGDGTAKQTDINDFGAGSVNPQIVTIATGETTSTVAEITPLDDGETEYPESYTVEATIDGYTIESIEGEVRDNPDTTFTLTTGVDEFAGGAGNDTFTANDTTLTALDELDGGDGTDLLKINDTTGASIDFSVATIENIETINLRSVGDVGDSTTAPATALDATAITGLNTFNVTKAEDVLLDAAATTDVNISGATGGDGGTGGTIGLIQVDGGKNVAVTDGTAVNDITIGGTTAPAGTVTVTDSSQGTGAIAVDGGTDVTVTTTSEATGTVDVGGATVPTGVISVTQNLEADGTAALAGGAINVAGGTTVDVTVNSNNVAEADTSNADITVGAIGVTGDDSTTDVTVTQNDNAETFTSEKVDLVGATQVLTFKALAATQTTTVNGLTFTAAKALTAEEVAQAFANLTDSDTQTAGGPTEKGTFSGALGTAGWTSGAANGDKVTFSSTAATPGALTVAGDIAPTSEYTAGTAASGGITSANATVYGAVTVADGGTDSLTTVTVGGYNTGSTVTSDALTNLSLANSTAAATMNVTNDVATTLALSLDNVDGYIALDSSTTANDGLAAYTTVNITTSGDDSEVRMIAVNVTDLTIDGSADLDLTANGVSILTNLETVTVTGSVGVTAGVLTSLTSLTSIDASGTSGDNSATIDASVATYTGGTGADDLSLGADTVSKAIDLGAGDDTLTLNAATTTVPTATVTGGDGVDTVSMDSTSAYSFAANTNFATAISGFERLVISDTVAVDGGVAIDLEALGFDYVTTNGTNDGTDTTVGTVDGDALTLNNMANNGTVVLTNTQKATGAEDSAPIIVNVKDAATGKADSLNIVATAEDALDVGTLTANDVESFAITATDLDTDDNQDGAVTLTASGDSVTSISITGDADLVLTTDSAVLTDVDASTLTGALTLSTNGTVAQTITGGSGDDVLTAAGDQDILLGGAGDDTLVAGNLTTLTGGDGADIFDMRALTDNVNSYATITDAEAGDVILTKGTAFDASGVTLGDTAVFQDYANAAVNDTAAGDVTWFEYAGNTYVIDNNSGAAAYDATLDTIIKIAGVVDLSTASFNATAGTGTVEFA
jgi:S-layer protein